MNLSVYMKEKSTAAKKEIREIENKSLEIKQTAAVIQSTMSRTVFFEKTQFVECAM